MKKTTAYRRGIALLELLVAAGAGATVILGIAYFLSSSSLLLAKNVSTNLSHNSLRGALDKLVQAVDQANGTPALINADGTTVSSGSAAGIVFDQYRGGPFVITHPGGSGLSASATGVTLTRSLHLKASPPAPRPGDVILAADSTVRMRVQSGPTSGATLAVSLQSPIGTAIPWEATTVKTARVVRRVAFVVMPNNGCNELRYFDNAEGITNFAAAAGYSLVTNNVGTGTGDATPFALTPLSGRNFLSVLLRVRASQFANRLSTKEQNHFSTVERISILLAPKGA